MTGIVDVAAIRRPRVPVWVWAAVLIVAAPLIGAALGETPIPAVTVWQALANQLWGAGYAVDPIDQGIVWSYRLPRALVAGACGAGLAISGLVLQTLLRNALADPFLLGISAGASTGAVLVAVAGLGAAFLPMSAGRWWGRWRPSRWSWDLRGYLAAARLRGGRRRSCWPASRARSFSMR